MATDTPTDDLAISLEDYEPDETGEIVDETGIPTGEQMEHEVDISESLQADVIDVALSQGPDGHNAPVKRNTAKQAKALQLRIAGHSYDTIAHQLGYTNPQAASTAVNRALSKQASENLKDFVKLQKRRYNYLLAGVFRTALDKDDDKQIAALNAVLSVMDNMNKVWGVDKVTGGAADSQVVMIDSESDSYVKELSEMAQSHEIEAVQEEDDEEKELRGKLINTQFDGWEDLDTEFGVENEIGDITIVDAEIIEEGDNNDKP